eukprot:gene2284-2595_t
MAAKPVNHDSSTSGKDDLLWEERLLEVPALLREQGVSKLNFVGGEPFLHPLIFQLIAAAKQAGLTTSTVTNGSCLTADKLLRLKGSLDWIAFSIDASNDAIYAIMGRGLQPELRPAAIVHRPTMPAETVAVSGSDGSIGSSGRPVGHLARVLPLWFMAKELGYRLKLNTVVTKANL